MTDPKPPSALPARPLAEVVAELRRLEREATPGPWRWAADAELKDHSKYVSWLMGADGDEVLDYLRCGSHMYKAREEDKTLIAAARNALPALLDAIEAAGTVPVQISALAGEVDVRVDGRKLDADEYTVKDDVVTMRAPPAQIARRDRLLSRALAALERIALAPQGPDIDMRPGTILGDKTLEAIAELRAAGVEPG